MLLRDTGQLVASAHIRGHLCRGCCIGFGHDQRYEALELYGSASGDSEPSLPGASTSNAFLQPGKLNAVLDGNLSWMSRSRKDTVSSQALVSPLAILHGPNSKSLFQFSEPVMRRMPG